MLLTLLTPCVGYVIVFAGVAGGDGRRLVAASPLLMLVQTAALPVLLWLFAGAELADAIEAGPFVEAFGLLIVLPLALAWLTLWARRHRVGVALHDVFTTAMVPLLAATLFVVVGSQVPALDGRLDEVVVAVPVYVVFVVVMLVVGLVTTRTARLDAGASRALVFSAVTRNSLVVLPLALALPAAYAVTPAVVVTQTLVELVAMVTLVRLVPRLVPASGRPV